MGHHSTLWHRVSPPTPSQSQAEQSSQPLQAEQSSQTLQAEQGGQPRVRPELVVQLVVLVEGLLLVPLEALLKNVNPATETNHNLLSQPPARP